MTRSLKASVEGLKKAQSAFNLKGKSQEYLAGSVGCNRGVVINFFARKTVANSLFQKICNELGLEWGEIAELDADIQPPIQDVDLDALVREVRGKVSVSIQKRCGIVRVLNMEQPITIESIYTSVNILEKISYNQRRSIKELQDGRDLKKFGHFIVRKVRGERIPALEAVKLHDKLMILGKPGAGKTTFLKWLAVQCDGGKFNQNRVPLFITLKEFAETDGQPDLLGFIAKQLTECGIENAAVVGAKILQAGRSIVLLDGLDEVRAQDHDRVLNTIRQTAVKFGASQFVITCRIAAKEYIFEQFTDVEVADFDDAQIADFANRWFQSKDPIKANSFPKELKANDRLQELATNPLLLTLLCLVFEKCTVFPTNRSELYKEGLDVLFKTWDANRNIRREDVYKQLSLKRKEDLLSQIAYNTFKSSDYFFKKRFLEEQIREYIKNLPNASNELEILQLDSEVILNAIAAHHGLLVERAKRIYSFSHLTFQEYFTARWFKEKADGDFGDLISHVMDMQWREVFLLTVEMLKNADKLLQAMKYQIDEILSQDEKLQQFLDWISLKSCSIEAPYKLAAIRAFYFPIDIDRSIGWVTNLDRLTLNFTSDLSGTLDNRLKPENLELEDLNIELQLSSTLSHALSCTLDFNLDINENLNLSLSCALNLTPDLELKQVLQQMQDRLPEILLDNLENLRQWWVSKGQAWTEELRSIIVTHCNIGHNREFSKAQGVLLQKYYDANMLLVDCLNSDCYVSLEVRAEIDASLLLPIKSLS